MDNTISPLQTQPIKRSKSKFPLLILIVVVIIAIVGGSYLLRQNKKNNRSENITPTQEEIPTVTPTPKIDKQTVKFQILNGTGTPGQANSVVDVLKKAGYNGDNISTDNASNYNHTEATIAVKSGFESVGKDVKAALESTFSSISIDSQTLSSDSNYDIVITTGGKIYNESTITPTSSETPTNTQSVTPTESPSNTPTPSVTLTPTPSS